MVPLDSRQTLPSGTFFWLPGLPLKYHLSYWKLSYFPKKRRRADQGFSKVKLQTGAIRSQCHDIARQALTKVAKLCLINALCESFERPAELLVGFPCTG